MNSWPSPAVGAVGVQGRLPDRRAGGDAVRRAQLGAVAHQLRPAVHPARLYAAAFLDRQLAPVPEEDSLEDIRALIDHGIPPPDPPSGPFQPRDQMRQASEASSTDFLAAIESTT